MTKDYFGRQKCMVDKTGLGLKFSTIVLEYETRYLIIPFSTL